ncbi:hypothetical protein ASD83_17495 [Devosia sp. Root685]|uniref:DUF4167 domain-containing protein n=1 Tax=Devosia sp. Root685 TaxID=1736587 RepID=UPI0006F215D6|nr:DUF4167 domain-containing protein [Devosia sp. Root685]KRA95461.1 hypothetical protein ASD83_17495 [Devosia sp. Root685]
MRPNQNKNRQRNRNGGRKHVNPLSRNYESNGPDVKVRGNAAHVAEKYMQLARDAQSSGDSVMAENYLQHAEHYFRIVSSAQQALNGVRDGQSQDDNEFDDDVSEMNSRFSSPQPVQAQVSHEAEEEQPQAAPATAQPERSERPERAERPERSRRPPAERPVAERPAAEAAEGAEEAVAGEEEQAARKPRERRPRRRRPAGGEGAVDPANAEQPDVGELPAFLTAGTAPAAE